MVEREWEELAAFGRAVRQVREERRVSVDALADRVGIPSADIEAIEAGRLDPGYHGLRRLPAALGITSTALLLRVEEREDLDPRAASAAFGRRLRELRAEHGVSQDDLARMTSVHATWSAVSSAAYASPGLPRSCVSRVALGLSPAHSLTGCASRSTTARRLGAMARRGRRDAGAE